MINNWTSDCLQDQHAEDYFDFVRRYYEKANHVGLNGAFIYRLW